MTEDTSNPIDERLSTTIAASNYRLTLNTYKNQARLRFKTACLLATNGGFFDITPEFLSFLSAVAERHDTYVLVDVNENPIQVTDVKELLESAFETYSEATLQLHHDFEKLKKARTTASLLEL